MELENVSLVLTRILRQPVKSAGGEYLSSAAVGETGLVYDKDWMFVEEPKNSETPAMFVAQRSSRERVKEGEVERIIELGVAIPSICKVRAKIVDKNLELDVPTDSSVPVLRVPLVGVDGETQQVQIWQDCGSATDQGDEPAEWATDFLSRQRPGRYRLVRMDQNFVRPNKFGGGQQAFHDGFSFTAHARETHVAFNQHMTAAGFSEIPINRWRGTLIFDVQGSAGEEQEFAHIEDYIRLMQIGNVLFEGQTLCDRCPVPCIDQETAIYHKEVNTVLASFRRGRDIGFTDEKRKNKVYFSKNFVHRSTGVISVGDEVKVLAASRY